MAKEPPSPETTLKLRRTFQAPRERVFRAWTDPKELALWFAPAPDCTTRVPELDLKVGGRYKVEIHHKGGNVNKVGGTYREIKPPEKIVFTWCWEHDATQHESLVTIEFLDLGPATEVLLTHERLPNVEERNKHEQGWTGCLTQLAEYFQAN